MTRPRDPTAAARMKRARGRGQTITCTLTCPDAIAALGRLQAQHGSIRAAIEAVLLTEQDAARFRWLLAGNAQC